MANENWNLSVGCVVLREGEVLLVRHTYGNANGKLLIPGGYCQLGEMPEAAALRELREETKVTGRISDLLAVRFHDTNWYAVFRMDYVDGAPVSDHGENSEALFLPVAEAIERTDVTELTKSLLQMVLDNAEGGLRCYPEYAAYRGEDYSLYGVRPFPAPPES